MDLDGIEQARRAVEDARAELAELEDRVRHAAVRLTELKEYHSQMVAKLVRPLANPRPVPVREWLDENRENPSACGLEPRPIGQ